MPTANPIATAVPAARFNGLITTASDDELVVYDEAAKHIHHLNELSSVIWRLCDGRRGVGEIANAATDELGIEVREDAVRLALRKLDDAKLLDGSLSADVRGTAQSRRTFMKRATVAGAAVPVIASLSAPQASAQNSCTLTTVCINKNSSNSPGQGADCCTSSGSFGNCFHVTGNTYSCE